MKQALQALRILAAISVLLIGGCIATDTTPEQALTPDELGTYYDYVQAIGGTPHISDSATIEATVVSLTRSDKCPSISDETCNTEPYPNDWATVRIDRIIRYTPYATPTSPAEQPSITEQKGDGQTTPGYAGKEPPAPKKTGYTPLKEGQKVSAHFILTTRPAKVRYVQASKNTGGLEAAKATDSTGDVQTTTSEPTTPKEGIRDTQTTTNEPTTSRQKVFKPIPTEGGYIVFTTKVGDYPQPVEKILSGLKEGDKFTAEVRYDGTVHIEEYTTKN